MENDNNFDLKKLLKKVFELGIHTLISECGKELTYKMISKKLFKEFYLFQSHKVLNNKHKMKVLDIKKNLSKEFLYKNFVNTYLDKDTLMHYY